MFTLPRDRNLPGRQWAAGALPRSTPMPWLRITRVASLARYSRPALSVVTALLCGLFMVQAAIAVLLLPDCPDNSVHGPATQAPSPVAGDRSARSAASVVRLVFRDDDGNVTRRAIGFCVAENGVIATSYHSALGGRSAEAVLMDGRSLPVAGVVAANRQSDIAILKVALGNRQLVPLKLCEGLTRPTGTRVWALGRMEGAIDRRDGTIHGFFATYVGRSRVIETTCRIESGFSGSPLFVSDQCVIGIITASTRLNNTWAIPAEDLVELLRRRKDLRPIKSIAGTADDVRMSDGLRRAFRAVENGDPDKALDILLPLREIGNRSIQYLAFLGRLHLRGGRPRRAIDVYKNILSLSPKYIDAHINLGAAYLAVPDLPNAIQISERAISLRPDFAGVYINAGIAYRGSGRHRESEQRLKRAIELRAGFPVAHAELGHTYFDRGGYHQAIRAYAKSLALDPERQRARINKGIAHRRIGEHKEAIATMMEYRQRHAQTFDVSIILAESHRDLGELFMANLWYRTALVYRPDSAQTYLDLATTLVDSDLADRAIEPIKKAIELDPAGDAGTAARKLLKSIERQPASRD